jgi:hypothetical protein
VHLTTKVVSLNPVHGEMYSIQHYVIQFVSDLRISPGTLVSSINKTDLHDITEILLKVVLNTINQTKPKILLEESTSTNLEIFKYIFKYVKFIPRFLYAILSTMRINSDKYFLLINCYPFE